MTDNGILRPLAPADADLTFLWRNKPSVRKWMFNTGKIASEVHVAWLLRTTSSPGKCDYSIFERSGVPLGIVGIIWQSHADRRAEWSFHIGADDAPKGSGTLMLSLAMERFFLKLQGRKMCAEVISDNRRSLALHEKLGFQREGLRRSHILHEAVFKDVVEFGLLRDQWTAAIVSNLAPGDVG